MVSKPIKLISSSSVSSLVISSVAIPILLFVLKSSFKAYYVPVKNYIYRWINYVFKWLRLALNPMQFLGVKTDQKPCDSKYDDDKISCWSKPGYIQKIRDLPLLKPCSDKEPGLNDVAGSCWATQTDRGAGKIPDLKCPDGKVQRGALCFDPPPEGNEWTADYTYGKKCPEGTRGDIATCWYDRGIGRIPNKRGCDNGQRDDGTSCWLDTYGNGVGYIPKYNDCPPRSRPDAIGNCVADTANREDGRNDAEPWGKSWDKSDGCSWNRHIEAGMCFRACPQGFFGRAHERCAANGADSFGVMRRSWDRGTRCEGDDQNVAGLCYKKCRPGYHYVGGNLCEPDGGPGIKKTLMDRQFCDGDKPRLVDGLCYPETKPGFSCTATTCSMSRNPVTPIGKPMWQYCKDSDRHIEGTDGNKLCYKDCPPRQHGVATMCIPDGNDDVSGAKCIGSCIKYAREKRKYCPPNQHMDALKIACYDDCNPGWRSDGALACVKDENTLNTIIPEIKVTAFDRSYCKDSENFKLGPLNLLCYPILPTMPSYNKDETTEVELKLTTN